MLQELNDNNYLQYINGSKAFYCLFYSNNLPNMKSMFALFEEFNQQFQGKIDVCICEIDKMNLVAKNFQMTTLPAVVFMKNRKIYGNLAGPASKIKYEDIAKEAIIAIQKDMNNG